MRFRYVGHCFWPGSRETAKACSRGCEPTVHNRSQKNQPRSGDRNRLMGSFSKLIYHIIFVTRYRRKTKLNLFANTFRIKRTIESNRLKRSTSSFYNATGLNSSDDICSRARAADCCRRFAAWGDWVGYPIPWAHTHGYMLPPLRGLSIISMSRPSTVAAIVMVIACFNCHLV